MKEGQQQHRISPASDLFLSLRPLTAEIPRGSFKAAVLYPHHKNSAMNCSLGTETFRDAPLLPQLLPLRGDFPCCLLTPLLPCNAHCRHGSTSPVPQPAAPHGAARPGSPPSSGSLAAPWRALLTTGIASLRRADVLHYLPESTNRFSQPLSLLNCKEKAPSPTG